MVQSNFRYRQPSLIDFIPCDIAFDMAIFTVIISSDNPSKVPKIQYFVLPQFAYQPVENIKANF